MRGAIIYINIYFSNEPVLSLDTELTEKSRAFYVLYQQIQTVNTDNSPACRRFGGLLKRVLEK
jgi:hypothetical protein